MITQWVVDGEVYKKRERVNSRCDGVRDILDVEFTIDRVSNTHRNEPRPMFICSSPARPRVQFGLFFEEAMVQVIPAWVYTARIIILDEKYEPSVVGQALDSLLEGIDGFYAVAVDNEVKQIEVESEEPDNV